MVRIVKAETYSCDACMRLFWSKERAKICEDSHNTNDANYTTNGEENKQ